MSKKIKPDYNARTTNEESLSLRNCMRSYRTSRAAAEIRHDLGPDYNNKYWKSRTPFPWFALCSFVLLMAPYAVKYYVAEFYERYELAFEIWTWVLCIIFFGQLLWRWWRRAPRRRYEVAVGACFIMGVIWTVMPCYNLLTGAEDTTTQYQLLAFAGVAFVLMIVFHYLWRRVRNRSVAEVQNVRAQVRRNKMKNQ